MKSNKRHFPRFFKILINVSLTILSIAIFFGSLELYARFKYFGGSLKATEKGGIRATSKGFLSRDKAFSPKKQTPVRIVCVGESTTYGNEGAELNYPYYLEQILNEKSGKNFVEVINSGKIGSLLKYHEKLIRERIDDQELDFIILHSFYNYFSPYIEYKPEMDKYIVDNSKLGITYRLDKLNLATLNVFLMEHSYFYTRLREKILMMRNVDLNEYYSKSASFEYREGEKIEVDSEEKRNKALNFFIERYYKDIEKIILTAKTRNVSVVLIIPPYPSFSEKGEVDNLKFRSAQYFNTVFERAKQCLIELGNKYDLLVIDTDNEFLKRGRSRQLFLDTIHLNANGNYILADIIASKIIPYLKRRL